MTKEQYFDYLGITKFKQAGYTGKNIKIMSGEYIEQDYKKTETWRSIICPKGYSNSASHGSSVMSIMQEICPDATYYSFPMHYINDKSECCDFIKDKQITLFTTSSIGSSVNTRLEKLMQECIDKGCTFFTAAGNTNEKGVHGMAKSEKYLAIGIADFVNGKLQRVNPSAIGAELDYVTLPPFGRWTSWCSPTFTAMCGLAQSFFLAKIGKTLNREELIKFINDNIIDIEEEGFDIKSGKGLFVLPDPLTINYMKYYNNTNDKENQISESVVENNIENNIENNVENSQNKSNDIQQTQIVELYIGKKEIYVNKVKSELDTAPFIKSGRTYVPLRAIGEIFGKTILWDANQQKITIC